MDIDKYPMTVVDKYQRSRLTWPLTFNQGPRILDYHDEYIWKIFFSETI